MDDKKLVEVENIKNKELRDKIYKLYYQEKNEESNKEKNEELNIVLFEILNELFNPYNVVDKDSVAVPISFLKSETGKLILKLISKTESEIITINDLVEMSKNYKDGGYSKQYISKEIERENIKATKDSGIWLINKSDAIRYFEKKKKKK